MSEVSIDPGRHRVGPGSLSPGRNYTMVWQECREQHPDGYTCSQFCELYRRWKSRQDLLMLQEHKAGRELFLDYAGRTVPVDDVASGEMREAQIFVAVFGEFVLLRGSELGTGR